MPSPYGYCPRCGERGTSIQLELVRTRAFNPQIDSEDVADEERIWNIQVDRATVTIDELRCPSCASAFSRLIYPG